MCKQRGETRKQRREQQQQERVKQREAAEFTAKMKAAKEAKLAQKLYLERQVKLISLPDAKAKSLVERWKVEQIRRFEKKLQATSTKH